MKAILHVCFLGEDAAGKRFRQDYAGKAVDLPFAPFVGMEMECRAWKGTREVKSVRLDVDELCVHIEMGLEKRTTREDYEGMIESYEIDGWKLKV